MCEKVIINRGEKEIGTPREFQDHFGFLPDKGVDEDEELDMDSCLCQCDIDNTFIEKGIEYKRDCGDYYVGQLEFFEED
jgi:hypothetical protein